jgi:hypothetical protein
MMTAALPGEWKARLGTEDPIDRSTVLGWLVADAIAEVFPCDGQLRRKSLQEAIFKLNRTHPEEAALMSALLEGMVKHVLRDARGTDGLE